MSFVVFYKWHVITAQNSAAGEMWENIPIDNYMLKVNNRNTRTRCEICSKLTIKTLEQLFSDTVLDKKQERKKI